MLRSLQLATLLLLLSSTLDAHATSDGGFSLRLLAVAGPAERFAILAEQSIQDDCGSDACSVFAVDVAAHSSKRLFERRLPALRRDPATGSPSPDQPSPLQRYLGSLDKPTQRRLTPARNAEQAHLISVDIDRSQDQRLRYTLGPKRHLSIALESSEPFRAAAVFDRLSTVGTNSWRRCIDTRRQLPLCSACKRITISAGHSKQRVWSCQGIGRYRDAPASKRACDCRASGRIHTVRLRHGDAGRGWRGNTIVAVPRLMGQNWMSASDDVRVALGPAIHSDMKVVQLKSGLLAFGSVANARLANGTFIPAFASGPLWLLRADSPLP